jgi:hypothetical protein
MQCNTTPGIIVQQRARDQVAECDISARGICILPSSLDAWKIEGSTWTAPKRLGLMEWTTCEWKDQRPLAASFQLWPWPKTEWGARGNYRERE